MSSRGPGLLAGYRSTIHWENAAAFREAFPDIEVSEELFEIDRDRLTCSGGTAALDLMLSLDRPGARPRAGDPRWPSSSFTSASATPTTTSAWRCATASCISHPKMLAVIGDMEQHLEHPLPRSELAERAPKLSTRQLERLFRQYLNRTPTRYYLELRLLRARHLADREHPLHPRRGARLRLRLGFPLLQVLPRMLRQDPARGAGQERLTRRPLATPHPYFTKILAAIILVITQKYTCY